MSDDKGRAATTVEGLCRFLRRAAELQVYALAETPGLLRFLEKAAPLLSSAPAELSEEFARPPRPALDPVRLRHVMAVLAEPLRCAPPIRPALNVWFVAGLRRNELRNAAVLAWFLNPRESHGLGTALLQGFLAEVARAAPDWPRDFGDLSRTIVATEEWPLGSASDRVDIALDGPDFAIFVEVKIDAPEGRDQLARYAAQARRKAKATDRAHGGVIYLSPRSPRHMPVGVVAVTWREVASALSALPRQAPATALAVQFAQHVRTFT